MTSNLFVLELRMLARERVSWVLLALFAAACGYGIWNGARIADRSTESRASLAESEETFRSMLREHLGKQSVDAKAVAQRPSVAVLPGAPLPFLATGQSDLAPGHESVGLWTLNTPADSRSEVENPSHLLAGCFDLAFVLVWLFPLFLLAMVYDLMAGDRESGTLRLALSQGISPLRWMARRALARALPMLTLAAGATLTAGWLGDAEGGGMRLALALAVVLVYGLFWVVLAAAVNAVARSASGAATALGAAWVAFVLVAPTLLNVTVESVYPTPSRPELVAEARRASKEAQGKTGELLDSFYRDHPELAPAGRRADFYAQRLTVQREVGHAVAPVRERFDEQLSQQQTAVARWRFVSPAIAVHEALTDLAGTGYWRYRAFREQVDEFKHAVSDFYTPKIHRREALTMADYDLVPRFVFREEPDDDWLRRVGTGLAGIFALCVVLAAWVWRSLRPARLGVTSG